MDERWWAVLTVLRRHRYEYRKATTERVEVGWHACTCGWEGYWGNFEPHAADHVLAAALAGPGPTPEPATGEPPTEMRGGVRLDDFCGTRRGEFSGWGRPGPTDDDQGDIR